MASQRRRCVTVGTVLACSALMMMCHRLVLAFSRLPLFVRSPAECLWRGRGRASSASGALPHSRELAAGDVVTVVGASGNVGKLTALRLIDEGYTVRAVVRTTSAKERLLSFLGPERGELVSFFEADTAQNPKGLEAALSGAAAAIVCTGTTAFPTRAWAGGTTGAEEVGAEVWRVLSAKGFDIGRALDELTASGLNTPDAVDARGVASVVDAVCRSTADASFKRLVLMSSLGVKRRGSFPFLILNAAGVLDAKERGEDAVRAGALRKGFDWTIVRPGQLFGGPYDNNFYLGTLFQLDKDAATRAVAVKPGDDAAGDTLRSTLAEVLVQCLTSPATRNAEFTVLNVAGEAPSAVEVQALLTSALPAAPVVA